VTTALEPITLPSGITLHSTYAEVPDGLPLDAYESAIEMLNYIGKAHQWCIGDLLIASEAVYGDDVFNRLTERTGFNLDTLDQMRRVAKRYEPDRRRETVAWSVYESLTTLDDADQDELLDEGEDQGWTLVQFRAKARNKKSGFKADKNGYQGELPGLDEQRRLASGDRVDAMPLELNSWPEGEVDLLLTSPPYGTGQDYDAGGDLDDWDEYLDAIARWSTEIVRLVNPRHGRIAVNVPLDKSANAGQRGRPSYTGRAVYAAWVAALVAAGMEYRSTILWYDRDAGEGTTRGSIDSPSAPHIVAPCETIIVGFRGTWSRSSERSHDLSHAEWLDELGPRGLWEFPGVHDSRHPAVWPEELPERLVRLFSFRNDIVADPMAGVGTAGVVAARYGRRVWMADRSPKYADIARKALLEARETGVEEAA